MTGSMYKSILGKEVNMEQLINQHEMTVAVGNVRVNARGDELGPGGKIIRKHEDVIKEISSSQIVPDYTRPVAQAEKPVTQESTVTIPNPVPAVEQPPVVEVKPNNISKGNK